jgi:uncharacterized Tic20 family protein
MKEKKILTMCMILTLFFSELYGTITGSTISMLKRNKAAGINNQINKESLSYLISYLILSFKTNILRKLAIFYRDIQCITIF